MGKTAGWLMPTQSFFPGLDPVQQALDELAASGIEERGAVYTRREVVNFILDLAGYVPSRELYRQRLLEPSFGEGDFLCVAIERLLEARRRHAPALLVEDLATSIAAVELHAGSLQKTRRKIDELLKREGFSEYEAGFLCNSWLKQGDFLLTEFDRDFDYVVGNPPYVRQELIPAPLLQEYRSRYRTLFDRADIYIPFIERSLSLLEEGGVLAFICSDRWMKNRYGGPLRRMISVGFHLRMHVDMVDTPAFHSDVVAYPAITVIARERPAMTRIAHRPEVNSAALSRLAEELLSPGQLNNSGVAKEMECVADGDQPWILESSDQIELVRRLERDFPLIEDAGCKIGIGVATGADRAFIGPLEKLEVEEDCKLPLAMTRDIETGVVSWRGLGVINPFAPEGGLVDLHDYPKLKAYLEEREALIAKRHVAKKTPESWYRTIDRIYPELARRPKLLIPDIKGEAHIVYEDGRLYPHHNLYYVTSDTWNLRALQAVLLSGIARLFVTTYSTRMRGGFLRFQAQYLRRIRVPHWRDVADDTRQALIDAAEERDVAACSEAAVSLYGMSVSERTALGGNGEGTR